MSLNSSGVDFPKTGDQAGELRDLPSGHIILSHNAKQWLPRVRAEEGC